MLIGLGIRTMHFRNRGLAQMLKGKGRDMIQSFGHAGLSPKSAVSYAKTHIPSSNKSIKPLSFRY